MLLGFFTEAEIQAKHIFGGLGHEVSIRKQTLVFVLFESSAFLMEKWVLGICPLDLGEFCSVCVYACVHEHAHTIFYQANKIDSPSLSLLISSKFGTGIQNSPSMKEG